MAKVANILVDSHCKKLNEDKTITAQWIFLKLCQNDLDLDLDLDLDIS